MLSQPLGYNWFIPGVIQPLHALIILLVHLDGCMCPNEEARLSRDLVDQVFNLRLGRILTGDTSINPTTPRFINLRQHNSRYMALITLKTRVWQKLGWSNPYISSQDGIDRGNLEGIAKAPDDENLDIGISHDYSTEDDSISVFWDTFTAGASLDADISNWDEWNLLSTGFSNE